MIRCDGTLEVTGTESGGWVVTGARPTLVIGGGQPVQMFERWGEPITLTRVSPSARVLKRQRRRAMQRRRGPARPQ